MSLKELHPRTNLVASASLLNCKEGERAAPGIFANQQLNAQALEIPALLISLAGGLVIKSENAAEVIQSDNFKMDRRIGYTLTALEKLLFIQ